MGINLFWKNDIISLILPPLGAVLSLGLTAYETQGIKELAAEIYLKEDPREEDWDDYLDPTGDPLPLMAPAKALELWIPFFSLFFALINLIGKKT